MSQLALVRPPSPRLAEGLLTHMERTPVDVALAMRQWEGYVAALQAQQRALLDEIAEYQPEIPDPEELARHQRALLDEIAAALV